VTAAPDLAAALRALEERLLSPEGRADPEVIDQLLADEFREIGSSGAMFGKRAVLEGLAAESGDGHVHERVTRDWDVRLLAPGVALVTYQVLSRDLTDGTSAASLRSSIWHRQDGQWRMVFHQGTRQPSG